MKNFLKKNKIYFINTLIIIVIFTIALILNKISPFGNNILSKNDAIDQFKPILYDFITKLRSGTLLNYSFNNGLGAPFIFSYVYYLASPLNLIAILFKSPDAMYLAITILKLLVASLTITYYVKSKTNNNYIIFITTLSYIFASWFLTYYYCTMWLDIFAFLPLYQKGLEDLLDKKKYNLYIISLAIISISNIYLAFPVYIYTIIYFIIYELIYKKGTAKEKLIKFDIIALSTIVSFLMISFFIYMAFDAFIKAGLTFKSEYTINFSINFFDFIKSLFYGNTNLVLYNNNGQTFPNIACNTFVFINCIYFFINKNITKKDKLFTALGILIVIGAIFIKKFDYTLNFFHNVQSLTYRYAFIINFLTIKMFLTNLLKTNYEEYKKMLLSLPFIIVLLLICFKKQDLNVLIINICFIAVYALILSFFKDHKYYRLLICLLIVLQSTIILTFSISNDTTKELIDYNAYQKENAKYRLNSMENIEEKHFNTNLYYNQKVTYQYSVINYNYVINLATNLGNNTIPGNMMIVNDNNTLSSMLFNVKQEYYLEKIFAANSLAKMVDYGLDTTVKENTENIIYSLTGIKDIYDKITLKATEKDDKYYFKTDYDYYLIEEKNEDGSKSSFPQTYKNFSIDKKTGNKEINIYVLNEKKLKAIHKYLSKNQIEYTSYKDNKIEGSINVDTGELIYTSVPYDESWEIKVDGKIVKPIRLFDSLIGIEAKTGKHTISMEYKNHYLVPGLISIITTIGFIIFNIKRKN